MPTMPTMVSWNRKSLEKVTLTRTSLPIDPEPHAEELGASHGLDLGMGPADEETGMGREMVDGDEAGAVQGVGDTGSLGQVDGA